MVQKTKYFWADLAQATDRLNGTLVCYGEEVFICEAVNYVRAGDDLIGTFRNTDGSGEAKRLSLSDPAFKRFRPTPVLGWMNKVTKGELPVARHLSRSAIAGGRQHGISSNNLVCWETNETGVRAWALTGNAGFMHMQRGLYPDLRKALDYIQLEGSIAVSPRYAIRRDRAGYRWLFRNTDQIGMFSGANTLMLPEIFSYLREEISEETLFNGFTIQDF